MLLAVVLPLLNPGAGLAQPGPVNAIVPLQCQLGKGPWRDCTMEVVQMGEHWWLSIAQQRLEFRHDGRGSVTMRRGKQQGWQSVTASWRDDAALCWDGVCARGDIPLD